MSSADAAIIGGVGSSASFAPATSRTVWRDAPTRRFLLSQAAGQFADAMTAMILARVVLSTSSPTPDPAALLRTLAVAIGPYAIVGPLAGIVADRWERRRTLVVANLVRGTVTVGAVLAVRSQDQLVGLVAAGALLSLARIVFTLRAASLPRVAPDGLLVRVDAASLYTGMTIAVAGASLGALGAAQVPSLLLFVAAGAQVVSAIGFAGVRGDLGGRSGERHASLRVMLHRVVDGARTRGVRTAVGVTAFHRALLGASFVSLVMLIGDQLGPARAYGATLAITGLGTLAGIATAADWSDCVGVRRVVPVAFAVPAVVVPLASASGWTPLIIAAVAATFLAFQHVRVLADATVQASAVDDVRGRVFSLYDAAYNVSYLGGASLAIVLGVSKDPSFALATIGAAYAVGAASFALRCPFAAAARHPATTRRFS